MVVKMTDRSSSAVGSRARNRAPTAPSKYSVQQRFNIRTKARNPLGDLDYSPQACVLSSAVQLNLKQPQALATVRGEQKEAVQSTHATSSSRDFVLYDENEEVTEENDAALREHVR